MLLSSEQVAALLQALGLTQSIFKPIPDLVGGLTAPLDGVVSAVDGIIGGLGLPKLEDLPLIGGILEAEDPNPNAATPMKSPQPMNLVASNSCYVEPYDPAPILSQTFPPFDQAKANVFRYRQQQSVNMGSWHVFMGLYFLLLMGYLLSYQVCSRTVDDSVAFHLCGWAPDS